MYKILSGRLMNAVGRGASYGTTPTAGPQLVAGTSCFDGYGIANISDGRPSRPVWYAETLGTYSFSQSTNLVENGDMEQGLMGWSTTAATVTTETGAGNFHKGANSLKVVSTAVGGGILQDVTVHPGEQLQLWSAIKSDNTNRAEVYVRNLHTGNYLHSGGTWSTTATYAASRTNNTMGVITPLTFTVEDFLSTARGQRPEVDLRVSVVSSTTSQTFYVDETFLLAGFDFVGVFGHNLPAGTDIIVYGSGTNYWHSPSYSSLFTKADAFYGAVASYQYGTVQFNPFVKVEFALPTTATSYPYIGEVVLGRAHSLVTNPDYPVGIEYIYPQVRMETSRGDQWVLNRTREPRRKVTLSFAYFNDADYTEASERLYGMSEGGAYPVVLVPEDTDSNTAIYGRVQPGVTFIRNNYITRTADFVVQEEPFPLMS